MLFVYARRCLFCLADLNYLIDCICISVTLIELELLFSWFWFVLAHHCRWFILLIPVRSIDSLRVFLDQFEVASLRGSCRTVLNCFSPCVYMFLLVTCSLHAPYSQLLVNDVTYCDSRWCQSPILSVRLTYVASLKNYWRREESFKNLRNIGAELNWRKWSRPWLMIPHWLLHFNNF